MLQILRVIKPEMIQICRFYGSHRNRHSHYETLRIPSDATQKDIRQAFIKLSKQMHPDISKNNNHKDFVELNEAYQVLSKAHTRYQHDMDLKSSKDGSGRPMRVVYYQDSRDWYPRQAPTPQDPNVYPDNYYGFKGVKRKSNATIVLLCIIFSAFGLTIQILAINKSIVFRRDALLLESGKMQNEYNKLRTEVENSDQDTQITALEQRLHTTNNDAAMNPQS